jgi:outer membrane protein OmpA-like peptidoglycan-associated protein
MNLRPHHLLVSSALALAISSCATVPPGPPSEVVRLQTQLDRLHADPRIVDNAGPELNNADAAVDTLARNARSLDPASLQQGVYIADRLVQIAEASALARYEERRGTQLGIEREQLLAANDRATRVIVATEPTRVVTTRTEPTRVVTTTTEQARVVTSEPPRVVRTTGELMPLGRAELLALQEQLPGMESRLDVRGLVVRFGDFQFEPNRATLMPAAERSLDTLANALRAQPDTRVSIETYTGINDANLGVERARAVSDYLDARGVDPARIEARPAPVPAGSGIVADRHVDVVIRRN